MLKWLRGRTPDKVVDRGDGSVEIHVTGDNNRVDVKVIQREVYNLANDPPARKQAADVVKPLRAEGIEKFQARRGRMVVEEVTREDLPAFEMPSRPEKPLDEVPDRTEVVEVVKPSFHEDLTWTLSDGSGGRFDAVMKDDVFLERVKAGEDFRIGDLLKVTIRTTQRLTTQGLRTQREVIEVHEEIKAPRQVALLPAPRFPQPPSLAGGALPLPAKARRARRGRAGKKR